MKKDKKKVIGEELHDDRLKELLTLKPPVGESTSWHILTRAYRALREDDFNRFIQFYAEAGMDLNPKDRSGVSFLDTLSNHQHAGPYLDSLRKAGAQ